MGGKALSLRRVEKGRAYCENNSRRVSPRNPRRVNPLRILYLPQFPFSCGGEGLATMTSVALKPFDFSHCCCCAQACFERMFSLCRLVRLFADASNVCLLYQPRRGTTRTASRRFSPTIGLAMRRRVTPSARSTGDVSRIYPF